MNRTDLIKFSASTNCEIYEPNYPSGGKWKRPVEETQKTLDDFVESSKNDWPESTKAKFGEIAGFKFVTFGEIKLKKESPRQRISIVDFGDSRVLIIGCDLTAYVPYISKLPELPCALIRAALVDLKQCMDDPIYTINMRSCHEPTFINGNVASCSVGFSGAVLARTFQIPVAESIRELGAFAWRFRSDTRKLAALDAFCMGAVCWGLCLSGGRPYDNESLNDIRDEKYYIGNIALFDKERPKVFFDDMYKIAYDIERRGY